MRVLMKDDGDLIALEAYVVSNLWGGPEQGYQVGFDCLNGIVYVNFGEDKEAGHALVREVYEKGYVDLSEKENVYLEYSEDFDDDEDEDGYER